MIGIRIGHNGIGAKMQFTHFPENWYKETGEKVIDVDNDWIFDYNPYIVRNETPSKIYNLFEISHSFGVKNFLSYGERCFQKISSCKFKINCRGPRLYKYEDEKMIPDQICIHLDGVTMKNRIKDNIIEYIREKYSNFRIFQIGGKNAYRYDFFEDKTNMPIWDTVGIIASSSIYIGINSGFMLLANSYPKVNKKIILDIEDLNYGENDLKISDFKPMDEKSPWLDYNVQYYNNSENDIGSTYSYLKI